MTATPNNPCVHHGIAGELHNYLALIAGTAPAGRLIEIRYRPRHSEMRRMFVPARRIDRAAHAIHALGEHADVYVGVLLRTRRAGGRDAVADSHLAWVDLDLSDAAERLEAFALPATASVSTGTKGHLHGYFQLTRQLDPVTLVDLNRRLARHLGGDLAAIDAARILRAPGCFSQKHDPPAPVVLTELEPARRYDPCELASRLSDPPASASLLPATAAGGRGGRGPLDEQLLAIPAPEYVLALTGLSPDRSGKLACPFHEDHNPSMQLYDDGSWYCFGACKAGGSIYDFGSRLWGVPTKGRSFLALRDHLRAALNLHDQ